MQDAAHILLSYDGPPLSFLQVAGAKEVGVEMHSMSKGFNMIGWRIGWFCGHPKIVQAFADVKDNSDSGQFMAIQQRRGRGARRRGDSATRMRTKYRRRLREAGRGAAAGRLHVRDAGRHLLPLHAGPEGPAGGRTFANAEEASQFLIHEQSIVCVPWDDAGPYLRFSVTYVAADERAEDALMATAEERLRQIRPVF